MPEQESKRMFFRCRTCGQSMHEEESVWIVDVKWPAKIQVKSDGQLAYMLADLQDEDILQRFDLSEVVCDKCHGNDVEVKEADESIPWMEKPEEEKE